MDLLFPPDRLFVIAGPCVVEDDALNMRVATEIARLQSSVPGGIIFKASFDKANRSNAGAARGPGFDRGLDALGRVRSETGLRVITDVHLPDQCARVAEVGRRPPDSRVSCLAKRTCCRPQVQLGNQ